MSACVYRFWGYGGEPVYVGMSRTIRKRISAHGSHMARMSKRLDICVCADMTEAAEVERSEITRLRPTLNRLHNHDAGYRPAPVIDHGKTFIEQRPVLGGFEVELVQGEPPIKSVQSFYNWKAKGFDGLLADVPLADVEIDDEGKPNE